MLLHLVLIIVNIQKNNRNLFFSVEKNLDAVSVRESSGIKLCQECFGVKAVQMLDPTLLISVDDYRALIKKGKTQSSKGNMLVYMLDRTKEKEDLVERISKEKGINTILDE